MARDGQACLVELGPPIPRRHSARVQTSRDAPARDPGRLRRGAGPFPPSGHCGPMDVRADEEGSRGSALALLRTYLRAVALLGAERGVAVGLAGANVALALVHLAEPV